MLLETKNLTKSFRMGESTVTVLRDCNFSLAAGEFVAIEGRSGSGKSTLLHLMGLLDEPDAGQILYANQDIAQLDPRQRATMRNKEFGFVFQFYHLLPELNVLENVLLSAMVEHSYFSFRSAKAELEARGTALLESFGLSHRLRHRPNQLSGGERQRVAIARALMAKPKILLADEPTGNLDTETGQQIMAVLFDLHKTRKQTIVMVTHDRSLASKADRALLLVEGKLRPA
jgi:lipoprotein-releasing system ATP-binding protein